MPTLAAIILSLMLSPESRQDLEFRYAVECFVMSAAPETRVPDPYHGMLEALCADHYLDRNAASKRLARAIGRNDRWLFWARRYPRAEIAYRANRILKEIHPCPKCNGRGGCFDFIEATPKPENEGYYDNCKRCGRSRWNHGETGITCDACDGIGSSWVRGAWE